MDVHVKTHGNVLALTARVGCVRALLKVNTAIITLIVTSSFTVLVLTRGRGLTHAPNLRPSIRNVLRLTNVKSVSTVGTSLQRTRYLPLKSVCNNIDRNTVKSSGGVQ
jgi:hypothetical protein